MMWRIKTLLLLLLAHPLFGATGDILSFTVLTNGWMAEVQLEGMNTNGTFIWGLDGTNKIISTASIALTVRDMGFDDAGQGVLVTNTIYGTYWLRRPYPNQAIPDQNTNGGNALIRISLSDYVHASTSNLTATVLAGWYYDGANSNTLASGITVTNQSVLPYSKVIAKWYWPQYDVITNSSSNQYQLRMGAFHSSAKLGRPVRCVAFWATDETGNRTPTNWVTASSIDTNVGDAIPVIEYIGNLYYTNLAQGEYVTNYWKAYPWVGDAGSVLDCSDGVYSAPSAFYCPLVMLCDKDDAYRITTAVVSNGGDDAAGVAITNAFNPAAPPYPFLTIGAAVKAIVLTNNALVSRSNAARGYIYLSNGTYGYLGSAIQGNNLMKTYLTISGYPGTNNTDVIITNSVAPDEGIRLLKVSNLQISNTTTTIIFDRLQSIWWDNCYLNIQVNSSQPVYRTTNWCITRCTITNLENYGFNAAAASTIDSFSLFRGNTLNGFLNFIWGHCVIGNSRQHTNVINPGALLISEHSAGTARSAADGGIAAYNRILAVNQNIGVPAMISYASNMLHGYALVQNVFEVTSDGAAVAELSQSTGYITNFLVWHNDFLGAKTFNVYNDSGTAPAWKVQSSFLNNNYDDFNIKADLFAPEDANRIGNWSGLYGVAWSGNIFAETIGIGAPGTILCDFSGMNTIVNTTAVTNTYFDFTDRQSFDGITTPMPGGGDYTIGTNSPAINRPMRWVLPYDLARKPRAATNDASGPYIYPFEGVGGPLGRRYRFRWGF